MYLPVPLARLEKFQRVALAALGMVPVVLVTAALLPAIAVLPLTPHGMSKTGALIGHLRTWTTKLLRIARG
jgi:hypothetical protein